MFGSQCPNSPGQPTTWTNCDLGLMNLALKSICSDASTDAIYCDCEQHLSHPPHSSMEQFIQKTTPFVFWDVGWSARSNSHRYENLWKSFQSNHEQSINLVSAFLRKYGIWRDKVVASSFVSLRKFMHYE